MRAVLTKKTIDVLFRTVQDHANVFVAGFPGLLQEDSRLLPEAMIMTVAFSVRGDVHELRPLPRVGEAAHQAVGEALPVVEQPLERYTLGNRAIVEKHIDRFSRGKPHKIRAAGIDAISSDVLPASR